MYKGVKFGEIHTSSYGLVLSKKTIETPSPKLETVDIPGADGSLDMTEYFGDVKYNNRKIKLEFSTELLGNELLSMYSDIQNDLHGKHFDSIVLDDDSGYRYIGRITSISLTESRISRIIIECDCEPYKVSITDKVITKTLKSVTFPAIYGDVDNDGVIGVNDAVAVRRLIDGSAITKDLIARADMNLDGMVTEEDLILLNRYVSSDGTLSIQEYADRNFGFERETDFQIDFGRKVVRAKFSVSDNVKRWDLYIDGILYGKYTNLTSPGSAIPVVISGVHDIKISTETSGTVSIAIPQAKL
jgi:hypothetical protein